MKPCICCGRSVERSPSHMKGNVYCTELCAERKLKKYLNLPIEKNCSHCGILVSKKPKETWKYWEQKRYCKHECYAQSMVGVPNEKASAFFTRAWQMDSKFKEKMRNRPAHSEETREKIGKFFRGRKLSSEHKQKIRRLGEFHHMYGKKHTPDSLAKMSTAHKGKKLSQQTKSLISKRMTGRKTSLETRKKMSLIMTLQWRDPEHRGRKLAGLEKAAKEGSSLERIVAAILEQMEIPYDQHRALNFCIPDFYLPNIMGFLEVDGWYWHRTIKQKRKDLRNTKRIQGMGFPTLRIPEAEIHEGKAKQIIEEYFSQHKKNQ